MIQGEFGDDDELLFPIDLVTDEGLELEVNAMLDTGFSEWLAINKQDLEALGWLYVTSEPMRTAQGDIEFGIYLGKVRIDGQELDIPVHAGTGLTAILLGRQWLKNRCLMVDIPSEVLTLGS